LETVLLDFRVHQKGGYMTLGKARVRVVLLLGISILLALSVVPRSHAQVLYGSVTGTATDPSGAVVAGAPVTITNQATGLKRQTTTDADGTYRVLDLPQGTLPLKSRRRDLSR
jgi:hypothetical protein